ncbi:MAG: hypothetical protein ACW98K_11260 [Candidatus Kariarchaeaceae archaeon]
MPSVSYFFPFSFSGLVILLYVETCFSNDYWLLSVIIAELCGLFMIVGMGIIVNDWASIRLNRIHYSYS